MVVVVVVVAFHGMVTWPAVLARQHAQPGAPVITVVTDLVTTHRSWREPAVDMIVVPSPAVGAAAVPMAWRRVSGRKWGCR